MEFTKESLMESLKALFPLEDHPKRTRPWAPKPRRDGSGGPRGKSLLFAGPSRPPAEHPPGEPAQRAFRLR